MASDDFVVDFLSLQDFQQRLQSRIGQAFTALTVETTSPGADKPALGGFHDAAVTAERHRVLHDEYVARVRRLVDALTLAQTATLDIIKLYRDVDALNAANAQQIGGAVGAVSEAIDGGRRDG